MDKISNSEAQNLSRGRYFGYCSQRATKESPFLQGYRPADSYQHDDLNQNQLENTDQNSKETFDDITKIFRESLMKNIRENHKSKDLSHQENLKIIEIHLLSEDEDKDKDEDEDEDDDLTPEVSSGKNNFCFESLRRFKPLKDQREKRKYRESSNYLALASQLFRHKTLASCGETLDDSDNEQSIRQNLELLEFLKDHQPFLNKVNEKFFRNNEIFKYRWLLSQLASSTQFKTESRLRKKLNKVFHFCKDYLEVQNQPNIYQEFETLLSKINLTKLDDDGDKLSIDESFTKIHKICQDLYSEIEEKLKSMNKTSFYYIKRQLEVLYNLAGPGGYSRKLTEDDEDAIKYFAKEILGALRKLCENYTFQPKIFRHSEGYFDEVDERLKQFDPCKVWTSLLVCYSAIVRGLKVSLIKRLSICHDYASKQFFETLLQHPSSFLMSKDILNVNWDFLDKLITVYQKYLSQSNQTDQNTSQELSDMSVFCANLYIQFEATDEKEKPSNFVILKPLLSDETSKLMQPNYFSSKDSLIKNLCFGLTDKIDFLVGKAILETKKREKLEVKKIKQLGIDFYSTHHDLDLYKSIKKEIESEIKKMPQSHLEHFNGKSNQIGEYNFSYAVKEDDEEYETDEETEGEEPELHGIEGKQKKKTLFNYNFLREVLANHPTCYLIGKNVCVLQNNEPKLEDKVDEKKILIPQFIPQDDPEVENQVEEKKTFDFNPNSGETEHNHPVFFSTGNLQKDDEELQDQVDLKLPLLIKKEFWREENSRFYLQSDIQRSPCGLFSIHSQPSQPSQHSTHVHSC